MLWTDADFISLTDLTSVDPEISDIADSLNLTITGNNGILRRGIEEAGRRFQNLLVSFTTYLSSNDLSANHLAAVFYTGSAPNQRLRVSLDQVVVTGRNGNYWSDIKTWAVNQMLIRFYLSASNKAQDDRYEKKLEQFQWQDRYEIFPSLKQSGCPIVYRPMPTPAASQALNPGYWTAGTASQSACIGGVFDVAITYVDQVDSPYMYQSILQPNNAESALSAIQTVTATTNQSVTVDPRQLIPPTGSFPKELIPRGFVLQLNATGFNVYVGNTGETLYLQNSTPLPLNAVYQLPSDPVLSPPYNAAGLGQYPEAYLTMVNLIKRA